jgi:hypothetical protein
MENGSHWSAKKEDQRGRKENGIAIKRTNGQRKLEQRTVRMFSATEEKEGWRIPIQVWLEMETPDDGEIFFVNLILAHEVESDGEEVDEGSTDSSWINRPWSEVEESEWCGRSCCREIIIATQKVTEVPLEVPLDEEVPLEEEVPLDKEVPLEEVVAPEEVPLDVVPP